MKLKGQLLWTDYLNSQLLHMQPVGFGNVVLYGFLSTIGLCLVGGVALSLVSDNFPIGLIIQGSILPAVILLYRYVFLPWRVKKIFLQQKELSLPFEIEITDTGLGASNEFGNATRPWTNFIKWKENKDLLLLYHSDVMYSIVPKRIFTDSGQVETIRAFLEKNNVPVARNRSFISCSAITVILIVAAVAMVMMAVWRETP